jgi:dTDP-4-dehydrorhamnose 3,5-epimerase
MKFLFNKNTSNKILGLKEFRPDTFRDLRGELWTSYNKKIFKDKVLKKLNFLHDKLSLNKKNVLRGLHGDLSSYKLVSCVYGEVFQVVADFRKKSSTFGKYYSTKLSQKNKKILLIPPGVANGFLVLSKESIYNYKLAYKGKYKDYDKQFTIKFDNKLFNIKWPKRRYVMSARDRLI